MPPSILKTAYKNAIPKCPVFIKSVVSKANVENVVKPPQKPAFKNNIIYGLIVTFLDAATTILPITIHPMIFIIFAPLNLSIFKQSIQLFSKTSCIHFSENMLLNTS